MNKRKNNLLINILSKNSFIKSNSLNSNINKNEFINNLNTTFNNTNIIINKFNDVKYFYNNKFLWEYGHLLYLWEHFILKIIINEYKIITNEIYNQYALKPDTLHNLFIENNLNILKLNTIRDQFVLVQSNLIKKINSVDDYFFYSLTSIIYQGQLYQESVNENLINIMQNLGIKLFSIKNNMILSIDSLEPIVTNQMIQIKCSTFYQGYNKSIYDNSKPSFVCSINSFAVSKYKITNYMYLEFINAGGYINNKYWTLDGWTWLKKINLIYPIYWLYDNTSNIWYEKLWDTIPLRMNNPVVNISWYEASAYCKWKGYRLLKESEWEYLAQLSNNINNSNLDNGRNYNTRHTISVLKDKSINSHGIIGLFGNCWEWCNDTFYPYDGFVKDVLNPQMSYPLFGQTKVCRGGSWASSSRIITSYYRKPIDPECFIEYTGFRVAI